MILFGMRASMKLVKLNLLQIQTMQSPAVENFVEIDGRTYAKGKIKRLFTG